MASFSQVTKRKRARRRKNAGKARKRKMATNSTPTAAEFFAHLGAPGQAAPSASKGQSVRAGAVARARAVGPAQAGPKQTAAR